MKCFLSNNISINKNKIHKLHHRTRSLVNACFRYQLNAEIIRILQMYFRDYKITYFIQRYKMAEVFAGSFSRICSRKHLRMNPFFEPRIPRSCHLQNTTTFFICVTKLVFGERLFSLLFRFYQKF